MNDPWGAHLPPAVTDPGPVPAHFSSFTLRRRLEPGESRPVASELPEVRALMAKGWHLLNNAPLICALPAVWPAAHRCWVPDRMPRFSILPQGDERWLVPHGEEDIQDLRADLVSDLEECGLPAPPPGRSWFLRSPWPSIGFDVLRDLIALRCEQRGLRGIHTDFTDTAREMLAWTEEQVWQWWDGDRKDLAVAWRSLGREGDDAAPLIRATLGPSDLATLTGRLTEQQAIDWARVIDGRTSQIPAWLDLGMPADPPSDLRRIAAKLSPDDYAEWRSADLTHEEIASYAGLSLAAARAWHAHGFTPDEVKALLKADWTLTPEEAVAFTTLGISPAARVRWVDQGFTAEEAQAWTSLDVLPNEARVWRSQGRTPADARTLGGPLPPDTALAWTSTGPHDRVNLHYQVTDPPGTRGRIAYEEHRRR